ncbi:MAG: M20/M25/M40 family metallo-hydrolase, partial [Clostridia bacterium]|nr:M20/M25/M40 family metallo-hydrolase [Clostridia bacterium]
GTRHVMERYGARVKEFIAVDWHFGCGVHRAVGSKRFCVAVDTEGGHSYNAFGNRNAIAVLASLIERLYEIPLPQSGKTTYNVGTISGGTSVNTIAQHAEMLYEFRSDERASLAAMQDHFDAAVEAWCADDVRVTVTPVGDRPCSGDVDARRLQALMTRAEQAYGGPIAWESGSTDCNIPLSMGVPAVCVGCATFNGAHTREEYLEIDSLQAGYEFVLRLMQSYER